MTANISQCSQAYWAVDQSAKAASWHDSTTLTDAKAIEYVENQSTWVDLIYMLSEWRKGDGPNVIFAQVPLEIVEALSPAQRDEMVSFWISVYSVDVMGRIRDRVAKLKETKANGDS